MPEFIADFIKRAELNLTNKADHLSSYLDHIRIIFARPEEPNCNDILLNHLDTVVEKLLSLEAEELKRREEGATSSTFERLARLYDPNELGLVKTHFDVIEDIIYALRTIARVGEARFLPYVIKCIDLVNSNFGFVEPDSLREFPVLIEGCAKVVKEHGNYDDYKQAFTNALEAYWLELTGAYGSAEVKICNCARTHRSLRICRS